MLTFAVIFSTHLGATDTYIVKSDSKEFILESDTIPKDSLEQNFAVDSVSEFRKEKLIAAILAFPVPFGFTGLHRIYLGSEPWVPVVYLCTGGGGLGLIPLIDFICIVTADEETFRKYENNPKFFMWVD